MKKKYRNLEKIKMKSDELSNFYSSRTNTTKLGLLALGPNRRRRTKGRRIRNQPKFEPFDFAKLRD